MSLSTMSFIRLCGKSIASAQKPYHYINLSKRHFSRYNVEKFLSSSSTMYAYIPKSQIREGSTTAAFTSGSFSGTLTKEQAKEIVVKLTVDERELFMNALEECHAQDVKAELEGQLAAFRWRSKFGRPSKVPTLGEVDPTGSYCKVPDDWLLQKFVDSVPIPTRSQLFRVMITNAIPFVGFGFLDNLVMIVAGEQIEKFIGSWIKISTMAAAAIGNLISDVLGLGSAYYVEKLAQKIGFKPPRLTPMQLNLPITRRFANLGRVIGVTIGCILGMFPLQFFHSSPP